MSDTTPRLEERLTALVGPPTAEPDGPAVDLFFAPEHMEQHGQVR